MKLIVCLDDRDGMLFNGRRQSRDRLLIEDLFSLAGNKKLIISPFSAKLFATYPDVSVLSDPLSEAGEDDLVFIESLSLKKNLSSIDTMIIYHWGECYPADFYFDTPPDQNGFSLVETYEFAGSSHDKITREIWKKQ